MYITYLHPRQSQKEIQEDIQNTLRLHTESVTEVTWRTEADLQGHKTLFGRTDIFVIEVNHPSLALGILLKNIISDKPTLVLTRSNDIREQLAGLKGLKTVKYEVETLAEEITEFLTEQEQSLLSQRFNCFLSPGQLMHLKLQAEANNMNYSEYLRQLINIDREIASR